MANRLIVNGELILFGDVGDMWGDGFGFSDRDVLEALAELGPEDITVRINSGGGFVMDGWAIYNALNAHAGNVKIIIEGIAASAASMIAMAGDERIMRTGSLMMIHDPSGMTWGTAKDHRTNAEVLDKMADRCAEIYAQATGETPEAMREVMLAESWLEPDEAVELGFATEVDDGTTAADDKTAAAALKPAMFDYKRLYQHPPESLMAVNRALPRKYRKTAASAATMELNMKTKEELIAEAKVAAEQLITDATAEATRLVEAAKSENAAAQAKAKKDADKVLEDATAAAESLKADAGKDAANVTADILARCTKANLTLADANAIVVEAKGSLDKARDLIIDKQAANAGDQSHVQAHVTKDEHDKFVDGATKGLLARAGIKGGERNEFSGMVLRELAREVVVRHNGGKRVTYADPMEMVAAAFRPTMYAGLHSTSDFVEILGNVAHKALLKGFGEAEETFELWTAKGTLTDFRPQRRVDSGLFSNLDEIPEGAEYQFGTFGDRGESIVLATYGKMFAITRQAIINDDINAFTTIPQKMGRAAKRTIGNLVYDVLLTNPVMADGFRLFSNEHGNLAVPGAAPSVVSFDLARTAMALQQDDDEIAAALNIRPKYVLVPPQLEGVTKTLLAAQYDPAAVAGTLTPNSVAGMATPIVEGRLSALPDDWFLAADANSTDTVEVAYLNGNEQPVLEQKEGWVVDGVEFKVRHDAGVKALGYRGLYKNDGGTSDAGLGN